MSAREWLHASVMAHLAENASLDPLRVFDAPPARAALPYAVVEDPVLVDWSTKDWTGREGRLAIILHDAGERPVRLRWLAGRIEDVMETLPVDLGGEGWRLAGLTLARSRIARGPGERWTAISEFGVRVYRANG